MLFLITFSDTRSHCFKILVYFLWFFRYKIMYSYFMIFLVHSSLSYTHFFLHNSSRVTILIFLMVVQNINNFTSYIHCSLILRTWCRNCCWLNTCPWLNTCITFHTYFWDSTQIKACTKQASKSLSFLGYVSLYSNMNTFCFCLYFLFLVKWTMCIQFSKFTSAHSRCSYVDTSYIALTVHHDQYYTVNKCF